MTLVNWILLIGVWIVLPISYVSYRNNTVAKKGIILSVTLPPEGQKDEEVLAYTAAFRKKLLQMSIVLTLLLLPAAFCQMISVVLTWSMVWLLVALFVMMYVYGRAYQGLKAIKRRRGWKTGTPQPAVEPVALKLPKPVRNGWFVPPMILSVLPVISCIFDEPVPGFRVGMIIVASTCLFVTSLSLLFHGLIYRQKPEAVDGNPDRTAALTRARRYNWTKTWVIMSWLTGIYSVSIWIGQGKGVVTLSLLYGVAICVVAIATEFAVRRVQQRLNSDDVPVEDEDDYWIWGQFYYNPNSKKVMIPERVGMNMNMNFATPAGKIMAVFSILVLLGMVPLGIWMISEENAVTEITYTQEWITVQHGGSTYEVATEDVIHAELLEELPPNSRVMGTGMSHLLKGKFSAEGYGVVTFCLNPQEGPFLVLQTADDTYFFSGEDAAAIYENLQ